VVSGQGQPFLRGKVQECKKIRQKNRLRKKEGKGGGREESPGIKPAYIKKRAKIS